MPRKDPKRTRKAKGPGKDEFTPEELDAVKQKLRNLGYL